MSTVKAITAEPGKSSGTVRQEIRLSTRKTSTEYWPKLVLILILAVEFCLLVLRARSKLFWYDELLTFHISGLQPLSRLRDALSAGADSMTLGYYLIVRLARMLPIDPLIAMRLPSILGYLLSLLGAFWFVTRKLPSVAGLAAVVLMALSSYRWYATEARAYALMIGFLAISAALWQRLDEKRFATILFGLTLLFAVASYALAAPAIACFAVAEIAFTWRERRSRPGVWMAFAASVIPFLAGYHDLATLRHLYAAHFWAHTPWSAVMTASGEYFDFGPRMTPALVIFCVWALALLVGAASRPRRKSGEEFGFAELVLIGAFLVYPAFLVLFMKLQGSGYTPRYGLPGILGLIPAIIHICRTQLSEKAFRWMTTALAITFVLQIAHDFEARTTAAREATSARWGMLARIAREQSDLSVVVASSHEFLEESDYGPADLKTRTVNLADRNVSDRLLGSDSADIEDLILAQFVPVRVEPAGPFLAMQSKFVLQSGKAEDWLTRYLLEKQYRLTLVANDEVGPVYIAER